MSSRSPRCAYCNERAVFCESSAHVYGGRDFGPIWHCVQCDAWVGCHKGTRKPLGRLANSTLRKAKQQAHAAFDPLWQAKMKRDHCSKGQARGKGYAWLAAQLGINPSSCHIGMFDEETCQRVVEICTVLARKAA